MVWGHPIFSMGVDVGTWAYFTIVTAVIAAPTGIKVFRKLTTPHGPYLTLSPSLLWGIDFIFLSTLDGLPYLTSQLILSSTILSIS